MKRKTVVLRLPREQLDVVRVVAKTSGVTVNDCVCVILTLGVMRAMTFTSGAQQRELVEKAQQQAARRKK